MNNQTNTQPPRTVSMSGNFLIVFKVAVVFTLIFLFICVVLSFQGQLNPEQTKLFETCETMMKMGFGAIIGLVGGKAS